MRAPDPPRSDRWRTRCQECGEVVYAPDRPRLRGEMWYHRRYECSGRGRYAFSLSLPGEPRGPLPSLDYYDDSMRSVPEFLP